MKAITVRQPWAWAIIHGGKDVENRTRNLAGSYRGPLAIHAGARWSDRGAESPLVRRAVWDFYGTESPLDEPFRSSESPRVFGAIIGVVDLVDVHLETPRCCTSPWAERVTRYDDNPLHHLGVDNPRPLTSPIPCKGRLGLWTLLPADVQQLVDEALAIGGRHG